MDVTRLSFPDGTFDAVTAQFIITLVPEPETALESPSDSEPGPDGGDSSQGDNPWRRPIALGISGLFLVFGIQLAFSGPRPSWSASAARASQPEVTPAAVEPAPSQQVVSLASTSTAWSTPPAPASPTARPRRSATGRPARSSASAPTARA
mgnify:CR=1 FL=1